MNEQTNNAVDRSEASAANNAAVNRMDQNTLEAMVDRVGLKEVLNMLAQVCHEKADHVLTNWQDKWLASGWKKNAATVNRAASKVHRL